MVSQIHGRGRGDRSKFSPIGMVNRKRGKNGNFPSHQRQKEGSEKKYPPFQGPRKKRTAVCPQRKHLFSLSFREWIRGFHSLLEENLSPFVHTVKYWLVVWLVPTAALLVIKSFVLLN
jgi:hypothetical protein